MAPPTQTELVFVDETPANFTRGHTQAGDAQQRGEWEFYGTDGTAPLGGSSDEPCGHCPSGLLGDTGRMIADEQPHRTQDTTFPCPSAVRVVLLPLRRMSNTNSPVPTDLMSKARRS
jgi:hypothetical protein